MKKLVVGMMTGIMVMSLVACGGGEQDSTLESTSQSASEVVTESTQPAGTEATEGTEATTGTDAAESGATGEDTTNDVANEGWSEEMAGIKTAVVEALGENYWPDMAVPADILEGMFGVTPDMYDDYMAEMPMMATNVDTLLIIKAKDDKVEAVQEALNAYRDAKISDTMQYPMNVGKIQASRIETFGNYVCFVQLGADVMAALEQGDEAVITQCQQQNELAIEVIGQNVQHE
ncbi:MAG: DUF4358 domain-containing protein [Lachnospiraceae bacterium]|nr:DUF4358 domain-containing protein [Lachnospiraceae bacterium]